MKKEFFKPVYAVGGMVKIPSEKPYITEREFKVLKLHWAGIRHIIISRWCGLSKKHITNLILSTSRGYGIIKD